MNSKKIHKMVFERISFPNMLVKTTIRSKEKCLKYGDPRYAGGLLEKLQVNFQ